MPSRFRLLISASFLIAPSILRAGDDGAKQPPLTFEKHVRPIFRIHCVTCHGAQEEKKGNLDVRLVRFLQKGGDSGPAIKPGDSKGSNLIARVKAGEMPPGDKKLSAKEIATLEAWINNGAKTARPEPKSIGPGLRITEEERHHWAFQPPKATAPPKVKDAKWPRNDIDRFILAKLEAKGVSPSRDATRGTLIRRLYFDLIGLPPTAKQVAVFEADNSPDAYEKLVDSLLRSPHFGERWARHWLDVARYSDTKGYVFREDRNYPDAWKYRDWVMKSLNEDLPFDRFITQQLAADRLPKDEQVPEAMGYLTLGRRFLNNRHDIIDDRIDVVTRGLMGLTVTCARCHDHKYDPIGTRDYYSLYGIFASSREPKDGPSKLMLVDSRRPRDARILLRGNPRNRGPVVPRQFVRVLSPEDQQPYRDGSGRLQLAQAIADEQNPLTARVFVNRVWGHLFGKGLVTTPSDFGTRSDPPTHPALLDDLAIRFVTPPLTKGGAGGFGWSVKKLIRELVLSRTYRQTSVISNPQSAIPNPQSIDPENNLLWRMNRRRLDFETTRDYLLAAAGNLDRKIGGPPVKLTDRPFPTRRTIYGHVDRQNLPGVFRTFDFASPDTHCPKRFQTAVPQQALFLLNGEFVMQQAVRVAALSNKKPGFSERRSASNGKPNPTIAQPKPAPKNRVSDAERIRRIYQAVYGRAPSEDEFKLASAFIAKKEPAAVAESKNETPLWQYGYGELDRKKERITKFHPLKHWTGSQWQGGPKLPDSKTGWVFLSAEGGHPGNNLKHSAIRRWTAPRDGVVSIRGRLQHPRKEEDGVRGVILSSRRGILGEWTAHNKQVETRVRFVRVSKGETIDFITECRSNPNHDAFTWKVRIGSRRRRGGLRADSASQYRGPDHRELNRWERLAHVLLISNEFQFVD